MLGRTAAARHAFDNHLTERQGELARYRSGTVLMTKKVSIRRMSALLTASIAASFGVISPVEAFAATQGQTGILSSKDRLEIYSGVLRTLDSYINRDVAEKMKSELRQRRAFYLLISDRDVLAKTLTGDLRQVSGDKHMNVLAHSELPSEAPSEESRRQDALRSANSVYGFNDVRRLPGNIGYVELRSFTNGPETASYASSVMTLARHTKALIIDIRENHGGLPDMAELLTGYMLGDRRLIAQVRTRHADGRFDTEDRYSTIPADGQHYTAPLYILTSNATFFDVQCDIFGG